MFSSKLISIETTSKGNDNQDKTAENFFMKEWDLSTFVKGSDYLQWV